MPLSTLREQVDTTTKLFDTFSLLVYPCRIYNHRDGAPQGQIRYGGRFCGLIYRKLISGVHRRSSSFPPQISPCSTTWAFTGHRGRWDDERSTIPHVPCEPWKSKKEVSKNVFCPLQWIKCRFTRDVGGYSSSSWLRRSLGRCLTSRCTIRSEGSALPAENDVEAAYTRAEPLAKIAHR